MPERKNIPAGIKKAVRNLKANNCSGEADALIKDALVQKGFNWILALTNHFNETGLGSFKSRVSDCEIVAIGQWYNLRRCYQKGEITVEEFHKKREEYSENFKDVFDNQYAVKSLEFITTKTQRPPTIEVK